MTSVINFLYHNRFVESTFHTLVHELKMELKDYKSVLDLGCGPDSPLQFCPNIEYKVGVEPHVPYLQQTKAKQIHQVYLEDKIEHLNIPPKSYDAVVLIEVIEHLTKEEGLSVLEKAETWAKHKVIITTPNGYIRQKALDENPLQEHLSGWTVKDFKDRGYKVKGLAGAKYLRKEAEHDSMDDSILATIKWEPKLFWFGLSALSQIPFYHAPDQAFELMAVKKL